MPDSLVSFFFHWGLMALSLWVASHIFHGISFRDKSSLIVAALLLGLVNAVVRPVLVLITLPLSILTFGLFLLVVNALMLMLVAAMVKGFNLKGFWTAFFAAIFMALFGLLLDWMIYGGGVNYYVPTNGGLLV